MPNMTHDQELDNLLNLSPSPAWPTRSKEILSRIIISHLPPEALSTFYPNVTVDDEERVLGTRFANFLKRASAHVLLSELAGSNIPDSVKIHINTTKIQLFWPACAARLPPSDNAKDPVVAYGWDRVQDKALITQMQDESADVMAASSRLAFKRETPAISSYLLRPTFWYNTLVEHLASNEYKIKLSLRISADPKSVPTMFVQIYIKLVLLAKQAAANGEVMTGPDPQTAIDKLCHDTFIDAINMSQCDDQTKEQLRNLNLTVEGLVTISIYNDPDLALKTFKFFTAIDAAQFWNDLSRTQNPLILGVLTIIRKVQEGKELKERIDKQNKFRDVVTRFVEETGKEMGLYK